MQSYFMAPGIYCAVRGKLPVLGNCAYTEMILGAGRITHNFSNFAT